MARETLGFVKLVWKCPNCGGKNPGPQKICSGCGSPQPEKVPFEQLEVQNLITDSLELDKAKGGADVHCGYCEARNPANSVICAQCGADLKDGKFRASGKVIGAFKVGAEKSIACPSCGSQNNETAERCSKCGFGLAAKTQQSAGDGTSAKKPKKMGLGAIVAAGIIGLLIIGALIYFIINSGKRDTIAGTVENVRWERSVALEEFGPVQKEGWKQEIPGEALIGDCKMQLHHTQSEPADNSEKVCGTPYTLDKGSGFGEVVQDCEYKVFQDFCLFTIDEWKNIDSVSQSGADLNPLWPSPALNSKQRLGDRSENYEIMFSSAGGDYEYSTSDSALFSQAEIGSQWALGINGFNNVVSAEPQ